ncbi:MAG: M20/M25/M40 family metallo-hydrolase, partial [Tepidisphaeraceae bacterium]
IAQIRDEGMNHSKVMETLDSLCNTIGPRLTGSPGGQRASLWTRDTLASWGLSNAHVEAWGPFGRGWEVKRFFVQIVQPTTIVLNGYPKAWSPGFDRPFEASVVFVDAQKESDLDQYKGKLKGRIVLMGAARAVEARFEPLASRMSDAELLRLASADQGSFAMMGQARSQTASERRAQFAASGGQGESLMSRANPASQPASRPTTRPRRGFNAFSSRLLSFVADEGAILIVTPSTQGDGGTFFVSSASIPGDPGFGAGPATRPTTGPSTGPTTRPRVWSKDAPRIPAQMTLAVEDYNRLVRMLKRGESLKMAVDLVVTFKTDDEMAYNTVAEIPGTDLKDEIVMVGAHLDSWHSGTGATDNGAGAAAAMEAVRIIKALNLKPRRTIRVGLWTGEEQGLLGSAAYVKKHFGHDPDARTRNRRQEVADPANPENAPANQPTTRPARRIVKEADFERFSVYFNLDNGTGKIRGIYAQSNDAALPIFREWLIPFADLGATTVTISNTGGTDHQSFDGIGLPGFQFIQDPIEYNSRTHHSNEDVYDRIQPEDMKQAGTIMAAFLWNAANMEERFPRKLTDRGEPR